MDENERRRSSRTRGSRLRSFALGSIVGAAGTIATARRLRRSSPRRETPAGLAAFEDAPCFRELVGNEEGARYREGGETETGRSKSE
jgi:hypothetical protein